jgi:Tol biopolymer transport system component
MTTNDVFSDRLAVWLRDDAERRVPDHLDEVLVTTAAMRQRPWWSSPERWLPVDLTSRANTFALPPVGRLLLVGLLIVALAALAIVAVGSRQRVPPPFGPARNGAVFYADGGDIMSLDATTKRSTGLVAGAENDRNPRLSPDGTTMIFDREVAGSMHQLMVAAADGTGARPIGPVITDLDPVAWSPDGSRIAVDSIVNGVTGIRVIDLNGNVRLALRQVESSPTEIVQDIQWMPNGTEILFRAWTPPGPFGLWTTNVDGTGLRYILPESQKMHESLFPAVSPDGSTVAYSFTDEGRIRLADIATGNERTLRFNVPSGDDIRPVWSPDGTRLVFQRPVLADTAQAAIVSAKGGDVILTGPLFKEWGDTLLAWSPDGTTLIERTDDGKTWLLDPDGGQAEQLPSTTANLPSWQRLAP